MKIVHSTWRAWYNWKSKQFKQHYKQLLQQFLNQQTVLIEQQAKMVFDSLFKPELQENIFDSNKLEWKLLVTTINGSRKL